MDTAPPAPSPARARWNLFLISVLILFLELACIRWFPAHVLFLTFFTNTVLLACFLGMSLGCLGATHARRYLRWTPYLLIIALAVGVSIELLRDRLEGHIDVGNQQSPQFVYFGTEYQAGDLSKTRIPIEAVAGFFFLIIALAIVGPGQELGRALTAVPDRIPAYTINILGSIAGIVLFAAISWLQLPPLYWFAPVVVGLAYFLLAGTQRRWFVADATAVVVLGLTLVPAAYTSGQEREGDQVVREHYWSPYYRIDYRPPWQWIGVNLIGHQEMISREASNKPAYAYALPYALDRDARRTLGQQPKPLTDVLIIGAGSGNDVSRALQWGAGHIDAVEIDPVIQRLGKEHHPDSPYPKHWSALDNRVDVHLGDGRNFLRATDRQYDVIIYALVDSLVLHSGYSNIRLESYLFTKQAFMDVKRRLKPGGLFVMYNYFRQGWIVARLYQGLEEVFGEGNPFFMCLPSLPTVEPDTPLPQRFTVFFAGDTGPLKEVFAKRPAYFLPAGVPPGPDSPNGFQALAGDGTTDDRWVAFEPSHLHKPIEPIRVATDDWPFLYLQRPMIPDMSLRGAAIMGGLAVVLLFLFLPRRKGAGGHWSFDGPMFFLGAGFMLIETKAVVHMALLFGSTWMVNSIVFFAILVMILFANLFVLKVQPEQLWPFYVGLFVTLLLNVVVPLDFFLGMNRTAQIVGSCLLVFAPILFAGVIFAVCFRRSEEPDRSFGANIAGAMAGGLAEYSSMLLGFQYLVLVALAFYGLSAIGNRRSAKTEGQSTDVALEGFKPGAESAGPAEIHIQPKADG